MAVYGRKSSRAWPFIRRRETSNRPAGRGALAVVTLLPAMLSIPLGVTLESAVWLRHLDANVYVHLRALDAHCLTSGLGDVCNFKAPPDFGNHELRRLRRFYDLERLDLSGTDIDDEGLGLVARWPELWYLALLVVLPRDRRSPATNYKRDP